MEPPKDDDTAPAYQDLFGQQPSNPLMRYSRVAHADENEDVERDAHTHHEPVSGTISMDPIPRFVADGQSHVHCDVCDRQLDRREKRRTKEHICEVVSRTFILIALFLAIVGIVTVVSMKSKSRH